MTEGRACSVCKQFKPPEEFGKDKRASDGLKAKCRVCESEYMHRYHLAHKEDLNERNRKYHRDNREQIRERKKLWREENKDSIKAREKEKRQTPEAKVKHANKMRLWRQENRERANEVGRRSYHKTREKRREECRQRYKDNSDKYKANASRYRKANKERVLKWNRNRKMRLLGIPGSHTLEQWQALRSFFNGACPCCGIEAELTVDHIIPISWEGTSDWITNIQPLCDTCNCSKHNSHDTDYRPAHVKEWAERELEKCQP